MRTYLVLIMFSLCLYSCNDGDVIVSSFDFEDTNLQYCGGPGGYLFFKLNQAGTESISLRLGVADQLFLESDTLDVILNNTSNYSNYRVFSGQLDNDYFCNEIPPTTPTVTVEYLANSGVANLITVTTYDDNDGIDAEFESNLDTDGDGIPNVYDFDDDGDNVPTLLEIDTLNEDGDDNPLTNPKDTDADGIPDYLDEDDDNDGVLTRYEDLDGDLDPSNDITDINAGANYLNAEVAEIFALDIYREHNFDFSSDVTVRLKNVVYINGEEQITRETLTMGTIVNIAFGTYVITPDFD